MDGPPVYHHRLATGTIVFQCVRCPIQALHSKYTGIRTRLTRFVHRAPMKAHCSPERTTRAAERSRQNNARIFAKAPLPVHTPVHPILQLQQNIGNRAVQRLIQSRTIRAQALQKWGQDSSSAILESTDRRPGKRAAHAGRYHLVDGRLLSHRGRPRTCACRRASKHSGRHAARKSRHDFGCKSAVRADHWRPLPDTGSANTAMLDAAVAALIAGNLQRLPSDRIERTRQCL